MAQTSNLQIRMSPQGRVVIPAEVRRQLALRPGESLVARVEDGRLVMEKRENVLQRLQARFAGVPRGVSLAQELIEERRREAVREADERPSP